MIFISVGTQLPFPRLIQYMERWCSETAYQGEIFGQVAGAGSGTDSPFPMVPSIGIQEFRSRVERCSVFVSHAGMGNIITALELGKPIVIVPRLASSGEHRNDHQLDTASKFASYAGVFVARSYEELGDALRAAGAYQGGREQVRSPETQDLLTAVREFIVTGRME